MSDIEPERRACFTCGRVMPIDAEMIGEVIPHARASASGYGSHLCEDSLRVTKARMKRFGVLTHDERMAALERER